jgi:phosphatidylinositol alpha-1,6-mannosyltransferase
LRILIVTPEFPPERGGIGTHCYEMAKHWSADHEVTVVARRARARQRDVDLGFRVLETPLARGPVSRTLAVARTLQRLLREEPFDLFYSGHWKAAGVPGRLALLLVSRRPSYAQAIHGTEVLTLVRHPARRAFMRWLFRWTIGAARTLVALGDYQRVLLQQLGVPRDRIFVSPEGVDVSRFDGTNEMLVADLRRRYGLEGRRVLVTVSRLVERKGHDTVIRALPAIVKAVPDAAYAIVGTGPNGDALRSLAAATGVADRVVFCGSVPEEELAGHYALGDIFVMASREVDGDTEGFGISFVEAAACGKASVGGRSGGVVDAVVDGETGILVDPDSHAELADAVVGLLADPERAARMGSAGRERVLRELRYERIAAGILEAIAPSAGHAQ